MEESEYDDIFNYVNTQEYRIGASDNAKRKLRNKVKDFMIKNGQLYYVKESSERLVISKDKKNSIITLCHVESGCHLGRNKTVSKISERYYWIGIVKDVTQFLKKCQECQHENKKTTKTCHEMIPVPVPYKRIWCKLGIDLIGPFLQSDKRPLSSAGYKYVLTIVDYTSKWPEAYPLYSKKAEEIASKIEDTFYRFGVCSEIVSDCGGEFNNKILNELLKKNGIKHITTSPYHPQGNGLVEKFNSTLKSMINKTVKEDGHNWHVYINKTLFAYRTSVHDSIKITPFEAMYVRKPTIPNEMMHGVTSNSENVEIPLDDVAEEVNQLKKKKDEQEELMTINTKKAQEKQKNNYDRRRNVMSKLHEIGEKVLLKNFRRKHGMGTVEQIRYKGPYEITSYCGKGNYKLKDMSSNKVLGPYNQTALKHFYDDDDNDDDDDDDDDDDGDDPIEVAQSDLSQNTTDRSNESVESENIAGISFSTSSDLNKSKSEIKETTSTDTADDEEITCAQIKFSSFSEETTMPNFDIDISDVCVSDDDEDGHSTDKKIPEEKGQEKLQRKRKFKQSSIYEYY